MHRRAFLVVWFSVLLAFTAGAAPVIDPLANVTVPAGKSLILPVTATATNGRPLAYTITSSTNAFAVVLHTNDPFWQLTVAQAATNTAPGAYATPYRGGSVTVTNVGVMTFMLFPEYAPHTVNVFQGLTTSGFYNSNTIFHRVVTNFVVQGGDPQTNGTGGLVFQYNDEFHPQAIFSGNGQLALANSGPNTDGSQFFVTVDQQRSLDFSYTLFGQLVRGFAVLTNINHTLVDTNSRPRADEIIQTATYVTDTSDTVITLTATNISGVSGKITVIADDGAGGRATNTFTATTVTDTNSNNQPFFYPNSVATTPVGPKNITLTNFINAVEMDASPLYWHPTFFDQTFQYGTNSLFFTANAGLKSLTYNFTNAGGQLQLSLVPATNYTGPVNIEALVSANPNADLYWNYLGRNPPNLAYQYFFFIFGDTPLAAQTNHVTVLAGAALTNLLLATFTNGVPLSAPTNFTASINWGDDAVTAGLISSNAAGQKLVFGAHRYTWPGNYPVYVTVQSAIGATNTVLSEITAISTVPKLTLNASTPSTNGFSFNLLATNVSVAIEISSNLVNWATLTNFAGTNASVTFLDPGATNASRRFYRAVVP